MDEYKICNLCWFKIAANLLKISWNEIAQWILPLYLGQPKKIHLHHMIAFCELNHIGNGLGGQYDTDLSINLKNP